MTFEEFQEGKTKDLRQRAKQCFDLANLADLPRESKTDLLREAQFYMGEIDRRSGSRIALRDLVLEIVVIVLIGAEIILAIKQGRDEDRLMDKQNAILTNLQQSTSDTATTMKALAELTRAMTENTSASAKTLLSLRSTTQEMNKGVHDQLSLFYDPSIALLYDTGQNRIQFMNTGRSGIKLTTVKLNGEVKNLGGTKLIAAGTIQYIEVENEYKELASALPRERLMSVPVEAHLENELGKHFLMTGALLLVWENDKVTVHPQTISVVPEP